MKRRKLNILLKNDFTRDSRVLKEAHTLSLKFDVTVLAIHRKELRRHETIGDFQVKRLKTLPNVLGVKAPRYRNILISSERPSFSLRILLFLLSFK